MEAVIVILLVALIGAVIGVGVYLASRKPAPSQEPSEAQRLEAQLGLMRTELSQQFTQGLSATQQTVLDRVGGVDQRLDQRLEAINTSFGQRLQAVEGVMGQRLDAVDNRLSQSLASNQELMATGQDTIGKIGQQLGGLEEATKRIVEFGQDVSSLKEVLQPPKLRGAFGEMLLEQLVKEVLPADRYATQHHFRDGSAVDLVIRTSDGLVPVDAKFPLETYRRLQQASTDEERTKLRKTFLREIQTRAAEVAKYIKPNEGTMDFAIMYVPAEGIFYEAIVGDGDDSPATFAMERQVHLASPNTFFMLLQVIIRAFGRQQIQENVKRVMAELAQVRRDFDRFGEEYRLLGTHIGRAKNKYDELDKFTEKLSGRLSRAVEGNAEVYAQEALPEPSEVTAMTTRARPPLFDEDASLN